MDTIRYIHHTARVYTIYQVHTSYSSYTSVTYITQLVYSPYIRYIHHTARVYTIYQVHAPYSWFIHHTSDIWYIHHAPLHALSHSWYTPQIPHLRWATSDLLRNLPSIIYKKINAENSLLHKLTHINGKSIIKIVHYKKPWIIPVNYALNKKICSVDVIWGFSLTSPANSGPTLAHRAQAVHQWPTRGVLSVIVHVVHVIQRIYTIHAFCAHVVQWVCTSHIKENITQQI